MAALAHAHATLMYAGHHVTLLHSSQADGTWDAFIGALFIGTLRESSAPDGSVAYLPRLPTGQLGAGGAANWPTTVAYLVDTAFS